MILEALFYISLGGLVLMLLWPQSNKDSVPKEEVIIQKEEEAPPPPAKPKEILFIFNTHWVKRSLFPLNVFSSKEGKQIYSAVIVEKDLSGDENFHDLVSHFILLCEYPKLCIIPRNSRETHGIDRRINKKYKMCKAVVLIRAAYETINPIVLSMEYREKERYKKIIIATFVVLISRAKHPNYSEVETEQTLNEVLKKYGQNFSASDCFKIANLNYIERKISSAQKCDVYFLENEDIYYFQTHKLPKKELVSIGDYNF